MSRGLTDVQVAFLTALAEHVRLTADLRRVVGLEKQGFVKIMTAWDDMCVAEITPAGRAALSEGTAR